MIQLIGWICLISLTPQALSESTLETGSKSLLEILSVTTINSFNESENESTIVSLNSTTENSTYLTSSVPTATDIIFGKNDTSGYSSTSTEETSTKMPISTYVKSNFPQPVYMGEMTTTYQTTVSNFNGVHHNESEEESSTIPISVSNLYFNNVRYTTEYAMNPDIQPDSPDLTVRDEIVKSTIPMSLVAEKTTQPTKFETISVLSTESKINEETASDGTYEETEKTSSLNPNTESNTFAEKDISTLDALDKESTTEEYETTEFKFINFNTEDDKTLITAPGVELDNKQTDGSVSDQDLLVSPIKVTLRNEEISFVLLKAKQKFDDSLDVLNSTDKYVNSTDESANKVISFTDIINAHANDYKFDSVSNDTTEISTNFTRHPKRIQEDEDRYAGGRRRPIHPDPGYPKRPEIDLVRPYRPDSPLHKYPYYRSTPDYRTSVNREDDFTRPPRPDREYQRVSFRPSYSYSKPPQDSASSSKTSLDSNSSRPYRPSFNRPYQPQSSFGRPYRPDFHRPSPKPLDDYLVTPKTTENKGSSSLDYDVSENSRADFDYTRQSEGISGFTKNYHSDVKTSPQRPNLSKPYRPYDSMQSKPILSEDNEKQDSVNAAKPDVGTNRPTIFYPRPGYGSNYQSSETPLKPFSQGTITPARNITRVEYIKADCFDNHMKVTLRFNGTFGGLVYSSGYAQDSSCSYVNGSGRNYYEFYIRLNRCGTLGQQEVSEQRLRSASRRRQERAQYLVNTVTVQYNPVIEEDIDEHFRVTCEYGYDFWKTVTFPVVAVESNALNLRTGSPVVFTLPPPQCNMEIRSGFGPSGTRVSGPVNVGDPLTLVIHMKSETTGFDILVSNCVAHNGGQKRLQLIDSNGCVADGKVVSPFKGVSSPDRSQQITLYSYLKAFRFTGSPALYIECDVHMCHGSCPPQRCYWRHLYKRSAQEVTTDAPTTPDGFVSESISLFQSLEVRHEEADFANILYDRSQYGMDTDDKVCLRSGGFAAIFACLLLLLVIATLSSICMCHRIKKMKRLSDSPHSQFRELGHVPLKLTLR